jgi:hypothetical protein
MFLTIKAPSICFHAVELQLVRPPSAEASRSPMATHGNTIGNISNLDREKYCKGVV